MGLKSSDQQHEEAIRGAYGPTPTAPQTIIVPTVGRVVWYWPGESDEKRDEMDWDGGQPLRADICYVNDDGSVNLSVNDCVGRQFTRCDVLLHQGDADGCSLPRPFATWMPYQKSQASKAEANEKAPRADDLDVEMKREQVRALALQNDLKLTDVISAQLENRARLLNFERSARREEALRKFGGLGSTELRMLAEEAKHAEDKAMAAD